MIALDTNVIVRFLVEDDPDQSRRARAFMAGALERGDLLYVSEIVLCETAWVLRSVYHVSRKDLLATVQSLLHARHLVFASTDRISSALEACRRGRGDLSDYLIREEARSAGCAEVATFERVLLKEPGFLAP